MFLQQCSLIKLKALAKRYLEKPKSRKTDENQMPDPG